MPRAGIKTWAFSGPHSHSREWEDPEQASRRKTELTTTRHPPASAQSPALGGISPGVRERSDWKQSWEDKPAGCTGQGLSAPRCKAWCWRVLWGRRGKILSGLEKERQEEQKRKKESEGLKRERKGVKVNEVQMTRSKSDHWFLCVNMLSLNALIEEKKVKKTKQKTNRIFKNLNCFSKTTMRSNVGLKNYIYVFCTQSIFVAS